MPAGNYLNNPAAKNYHFSIISMQFDEIDETLTLKSKKIKNRPIIFLITCNAFKLFFKPLGYLLYKEPVSFLSLIKSKSM